MGKKRASQDRHEPLVTDGSAEPPPQETRRQTTPSTKVPKQPHSPRHRKIILISPLADLSAHAHLVTRLYPEQTPPAEIAVVEESSARPGLSTETVSEPASLLVNADRSAALAVAGWASNWECTAAPVLAGLALAWQLCGLHTIFAAHIDFLPTTSVMVTVLALLIASVGAGLPERAMSLVQRLIRQLSESPGDQVAFGGRLNPLWLLGLARQSDPELTWISLAILSSAGGLLVLFSLALGGLAFEAHRWLLTHFFWTSLTMAGMEWATCGVIIMAPWIACGLTLVMLASVADVHHNEPRRAGQRVVTGVLAGLGVGWLLHGPFMAWGMSAEREAMIGSLPLFAIAVIGARASQRAELLKPGTDSTGSTAPELAAGGELLAGLASIVWTIGIAAAWTGWLVCHGDWHARHRLAPEDLGVLLTGASIAGALAARRRSYLSSQVAGYGVAMWMCGIGAGAAASLVVWWPDSAVSWVLQVCLLAVTTGYGIHQVTGYWLARASNVTLGFAHLSITLLTGTAIGLAASRWWGLPNLGAMGTLAAGSLALLAAGGLLEIHEEHQPAWTKRLKLALVFASLAAAILLFPANTRMWTRRERESAIAASVKTHPSALLKRALDDVRTACMIGIDPSSLGESLPPLLDRAEIVPLMPSLPRRDVADARGRLHVLTMPAARWLRLHRMRYQFIYQLGRPLAQGQGAEYTAEWLYVLADHLAVGGRFMLEVPLEGLSRRDIAVLAATFEHVTTSAATWRLSDSAQPRMIFQTAAAGPGGRAADARNWYPLGRLVEGVDGLSIHSIRRLRISGRAAENTASVVQWLMNLAGVAR